jgi:hypothetical protein
MWCARDVRVKHEKRSSAGPHYPGSEPADTERHANADQRSAAGAGGDALELRFDGRSRVDERWDNGLIEQDLHRQWRRRPLQEIVLTDQASLRDR